MAKQVPLGSVIGVDIFSSMIATAQALTQENLIFRVEDAPNVDFNQKFDLITSL